MHEYDEDSDAKLGKYLFNRRLLKILLENIRCDVSYLRVSCSNIKVEYLFEIIDIKSCIKFFYHVH